MDWLQFISSVISSIAWPVVAILVLLILKENISSLSPFIERLKYKDFEVEFRKGVLELKAQSESDSPQPTVDEQAEVPRNRLYLWFVGGICG